MKKTIITIILLLLVTNVTVYAVDTRPLEPGETRPPEEIMIRTSLSGEFEYISYMIRDTGAKSGIRYRTKEITFELNGMRGKLPTSVLDKQIKPAPGQTVYTLISIDKKDLIEIFGQANAAQVIEALKNPGNLNIGATIEIYNAATGKTLDTIYRQDDIYEIAHKYGFSFKSIEDMKSEWKGKNDPVPPPLSKPTPEPEPESEEDEEPELPETSSKKGLRPSVLVWD